MIELRSAIVLTDHRAGLVAVLAEHRAAARAAKGGTG